MKYDVLGIGTPVSDYLINVEHLPKPNSGARMLANAWQYGGKVASAMAALGRLGTRCAMMAVVGDDPDGYAQKRDFEFNGVSTEHLILKEGFETAYCVVISDLETAGRSILGCPRNVPRLTVDMLDKAAIQDTRYLHIESGNEVSRQAAIWCREAGGQICVDADGYNAEIEAMIPLVDIFIPSEFYYKTRYGTEQDPLACCREMAAQGPHTVIITLGEKGCVGVSPAGEFQLPSFSVEVVDTTGAGDVFHGAFLYGMVQGWDAQRAARFASAFAAIKCTAVGGRAALATPDMVERFMAAGGKLSEEDRAVIAQRVARYSKMPYGRN